MIEMNEPTARRILGEVINDDNSLSFNGSQDDDGWKVDGWVSQLGRNDICLDGYFHPEVLLAIAWWMLNMQKDFV